MSNQINFDNLKKFIKDANLMETHKLRVVLDKNGFMRVTGWTTFEPIKNMKKDDALNELSEIKMKISQFLKTTPGIDKLRNYLKIKYTLAYDYGMGGVGVCEEKNGKINWITKNLISN